MRANRLPTRTMRLPWSQWGARFDVITLKLRFFLAPVCTTRTGLLTTDRI
jgi:hypothetical protein